MTSSLFWLGHSILLDIVFWENSAPLEGFLLSEVRILDLRFLRLSCLEAQWICISSFHLINKLGRIIRKTSVYSVALIYWLSISGPT